MDGTGADSLGLFLPKGYPILSSSRFLKTWCLWTALLAWSILPSLINWSSNKRLFFIRSYINYQHWYSDYCNPDNVCMFSKTDRGLGSHCRCDGLRLRNGKQVQNQELTRTGGYHSAIVVLFTIIINWLSLIIQFLRSSSLHFFPTPLFQNVYKAKEDTECCTRMVCGPNRPFEMQIFDNADNEVSIFVAHTVF